MRGVEPIIVKFNEKKDKDTVWTKVKLGLKKTSFIVTQDSQKRLTAFAEAQNRKKDFDICTALSIPEKCPSPTKISIGKLHLFSWEPALETPMSGDRVLLLMMMMMSKKKHCNFRQ